MKWLHRAVATAWVVCPAIIGWDLIPRKARADLDAAAPPSAAWAAPGWHPGAEALHLLPEMAGAPRERGPRLSARAAYLFDVEAGEVLVARAADDRRPVASLTKLVSALALASESPDLDLPRCVDSRFWPTRSGARSRLSTGECYRGWDLLGAALVASDNRGAFGMQVASDLRYADFIGRMDEVSLALGMDQSTWSDPSGLEDENLSTARDMARAALAVAAHPDLALAASARTWRVERVGEAEVEAPATPGSRELRSTNRLLERPSLDVMAGKTGYTDTAGYCFAGVVRSAGGRLLALSVLGAPRSAARWQDVDRLLAWADQQDLTSAQR